MNSPLRICDFVKPWAESSPERLALVEPSGAWTYRELSAVIDETESWLLALGVRPGDRVMIVCENCRALVAILLALAKMDAWPVLVNSRLAPREVDAIQEHCRARIAIFTVEVSPQARNHARRMNAIIQKVSGIGTIGVGSCNEISEPEALDPQIADRVAALIYTSGTTGLPKGVMLTHRNLLFVASGSAQIRSLSPDDRLYGALPISHAVGLSVVLLGTLLSGATLYLVERFDPAATLAAMKRDALTVFLGAPAMFSLLVEYARLKGYQSLKFPALRIISSSGAPLYLPLKSEVESLFGLVLHNGYGITECSPNIASTRPEAPRRDTSVGPIFPGVEAKVCNEAGDGVPEGDVGELIVRGPNIMKGYYRSPEETATAIDKHGWFKTRDLARIEDGNLFIVGRTKELIVRFGFNVYPAEVEAVLNAHPSVLRSAVIGQEVPGSQGGEEVIAFVQTVPDSAITAKELAQHASLGLVSYKRPSRIELVSAMPLTPTGKIIKANLLNRLSTRSFM